MATAVDYNLGPNTFPRGWFIVAESKELDEGPMAIRYFGQDLALYRGESGKPVLLDAYCAHMGTHITASTSAVIVKNGEQIPLCQSGTTHNGCAGNWTIWANWQCTRRKFWTIWLTFATLDRHTARPASTLKTNS